MSSFRAFCIPIAVGENRLSPEESHHLGTVLRVRKGTELELFDGAGHAATATFERFDRRIAIVSVRSISHRPFDLAHRLTLAFAPVKQHRQSFLIEKCTELGVFALWPMVTARGVAKSGASAIEKWRRRAVEAAKQSGRAWLPAIEEPQPFQTVAGRARSFDVAAICDTTGAAQPVRSLFDTVTNNTAVIVLVGPEGGWSDQERDAARRADLTPVSLGPTTLRAETAAVAVCAACAAYAANPPGSTGEL